MYGHPNNKPNYLAATIAIAACTFSLSSSGELQLAPAGEFSARDGRPFDAATWKITDETAPRLLAALAAHQDKIVIDYEHQTLHAEKNGQPAIASGWFYGADVQYRPGQGLFVVPEWTEKAKGHIDDKEYKYFSPVIKYNKHTGEVLDILMGALTNYAAIDGMQEVEAMAAAKYMINPQTNQPAEENPMLEQLIALLGLKAGTSEADVMAALKAVMQQNQEADEAIAAAKAETPDDAMTSIKAMQTELTALKSDINDTAVADLVDSAMADGRLLPAQEDWARNLGKSNIASLKTFLEDAQPVAALTGSQTDGKKPEGTDQNALDETALAVCKQMGIDPADYQKTQQEDAA